MEKETLKKVGVLSIFSLLLFIVASSLASEFASSESNIKTEESQINASVQNMQGQFSVMNNNNENVNSNNKGGASETQHGAWKEKGEAAWKYWNDFWKKHKQKHPFPPGQGY